jgi:hypothetical protein
VSLNVTTRNIHVNLGQTPQRRVVVTQPQVQQIRTGQQGLPGGPGEDGQQGVAGPSGDGQYPAVAFAFGDASSIVMALTGDHASEVTDVLLEIETPFDGAGAQIQFGTPLDPDLLMPADQNDPSTVAVYQVSPHVRLGAGQPIYLTITAGTGATQGAGKIILRASPTT